MKSEQSQCENITDAEALLEGYNRPMMEVLRKKQASESLISFAESDEIVVKKRSRAHLLNDESVTPTTTKNRARGRPRKLAKIKVESTIPSTFTTTDESSSSSDSSGVNNSPYKVENFGSSIGVMEISGGSASDEFSPVKTRHHSKLNGLKTSKSNSSGFYNGINGNDVALTTQRNTDDYEKLIGARRRKRSVPKKSNGGVTKGESVV